MTKVTTREFILIRPNKAGRSRKVDFKKVYFDLWGEAYSLHKQFSEMLGTDENWEKLVKTSEEIMKKYEKEPQADFMRSLLLAVLAEIERADKQRKEGAVNGTHGKLEQVCKGDTENAGQV